MKTVQCQSPPQPKTISLNTLVILWVCLFSLFHLSKHPILENTVHVSDFLLLASWFIALVCDPSQGPRKQCWLAYYEVRDWHSASTILCHSWEFSVPLKANLIPMAIHIEGDSHWSSSIRLNWVSLLPWLVKSDLSLISLLIGL